MRMGTRRPSVMPRISALRVPEQGGREGRADATRACGEAACTWAGVRSIEPNFLFFVDDDVHAILRIENRLPTADDAHAFYKKFVEETLHSFVIVVARTWIGHGGLERTVHDVLAIPFDADVDEADFDWNVRYFEEIVTGSFECVFNH